MTQYSIRGEIVNLTGAPLKLVTDAGTKIRNFQKGDLAVVNTEEVYLGYINNKIELGYSRPISITGLPPMREGKYYIVSGKVARAAYLIGRPTTDLLVADLPLIRHEGNAREILGYRRLVLAAYYCQTV